MFDNVLTRIATSILIGGLFFALVMILLPTYGLPDNLEDAFHYLFELVWILDFAIPIPTLIHVASLLILMELIETTVYVATFIKKHLIKAP